MSHLKKFAVGTVMVALSLVVIVFLVKKAPESVKSWFVIA